MPNPMIFVDMPTPDPEASSRFYEALFGWQVNRRPAGEFHEILPGVKPNLGMHREETAVVGPVPRIYIMVDDMQATLTRVTAAGGEIAQPVGADAPEITARFRDPGGNILGLYQERSLAK